MTDLVILGSDTDAGKTTFAALWLTLFAERYAYWKPVETGPSDSDRIRELVPGALVHPPGLRFASPVAPPLAARRQDASIPTAATLAALRPQCDRPLLIETFGSPFSPLNDEQLQIELIEALACPSVLVSSSSLGAIGRTLQCLFALEGYGRQPKAVVLLGAVDAFAVEKISQHRPRLRVVCLTPPEEWTSTGIQRAAEEQRAALHSVLGSVCPQGIPRARTKVVELLDLDRRFVWHPYTSLQESDPPLVCVGARDEFLHLADGRRVIDGISSWWTILHGHRFAPLMEALRETAGQYDHVHFAGVTHGPGVELAELLLSTMPWSGGGRVFYSDDGSTAVEVALKMAYQFWCHRGQPERTRFVGFEHGYHGDTFGAMAVSRDRLFFGRFEPLLFRADILPLSAEKLDGFLGQHGAQVAAVILEPLVQGAGGMRMHNPSELKALFEVANNHGVLFIADEVMTGGGRLGTLWAHQQAAIAPDLVCAAKTLAGGVLPLAATLAAPHIAAAWDTADRTRTFFHGHSFTAHPLACAVALANWKLLTERMPSAPARMEEFWKKALDTLGDHPTVKDIRILGSIAAVELDVPGGYLAEAGGKMRRVSLENGVLLRPLGSVLYAMPPLCTSEESLTRIAEAMIRALGGVSGRQ